MIITKPTTTNAARPDEAIRSDKVNRDLAMTATFAVLRDLSKDLEELMHTIDSESDETAGDEKAVATTATTATSEKEDTAESLRSALMRMMIVLEDSKATIAINQGERLLQTTEIDKMMVGEIEKQYDDILKQIEKMERQRRRAKKWGGLGKIVSGIMATSSIVLIGATAGMGAAAVMAAYTILDQTGVMDELNGAISKGLQDVGVPRKTADFAASAATVLIVVAATAGTGAMAGAYARAGTAAASTATTAATSAGTTAGTTAATTGAKAGAAQLAANTTALMYMLAGMSIISQGVLRDGAAALDGKSLGPVDFGEWTMYTAMALEMVIGAALMVKGGSKLNTSGSSSSAREWAAMFGAAGGFAGGVTEAVISSEQAKVHFKNAEIKKYYAGMEENLVKLRHVLDTNSQATKIHTDSLSGVVESLDAIHYNEFSKVWKETARALR